MKIESYWLATTPRFASASSSALEGRADVAVIGGGFTGLSAALALARKGASVTVLEAERVAAAASGRNGGHCNSGLSHDFADMVERRGLETASAFYRAFDAAVDTVERIVATESLDCGFWRSGKIKLAAKPAHYEGLARSFELLQRTVDPDTVLVPAERLAAEIGSTAFHGGLLQKRSAMMHMGRFGAGLAEAAARHGARIFEQAPVTTLKRRGDKGYDIVTPRGNLRANQVLVATGAYTRGPFGYFLRRIVPVGSFIVATEPLAPSVLESIMPTRRTATTTRIIGNYFRISPDNRLIFGGRARFALSNPQSDTKGGEILQATMRQVFPQLKDTRIDYCWGGLIDMTPDRLPRAGEKDGLYYAMGYSGHGVQMSVHMGQVMAEVMSGHPERNPWRTLPWPAVPGHFGTPWFLPLVGVYYRIKDKLH
jgi:glycine/D-amino acid oxidase-like deaminating enzyme